MSSRKYRETHEWAQPDAQNETVTVGISQHAVETLGDIVYLELPESGRQVQAGQMFGTVESVKAASDLYAPVGGEITEVNQEVAEDLNRFKEDPFGAAWLVKIRMADASELDKLMDEKAYADQVAGEEA